MRRAGAAAWRLILQRWPQALRIVVVCGPGNNGGDGYVLARHALESGRDVLVLQQAGGIPRQASARRACTEYRAAGGRILVFSDALPEADLFVDALFGIGLASAPKAASAALINALNRSGTPILALDVPSGVDSDTGAVAGTAVRADCTLEFIASHQGLRTGAALEHVGATRLATLELPAQAWHDVLATADQIEPASLAARLPTRSRNTHKGNHGRVLCVGGDHGAGGAIVLSAHGALRVGAGLVSVLTRPDHVAALLARLPECMAWGTSIDSEDALTSDVAADAIAALLARADVLAVGPGLGTHAWGRHWYAKALGSGKPLVLDADGLTLLAATPQPLPAAVLTPHPGEAARLLASDIKSVQSDRYHAARDLAARFDCVVVLKGAGTVVAAPHVRSVVIGAGNPGMATGGMGDVLAGVIAGLLAQGHALFDAACTGALLHAHAGDLAARAGARGLLPSDVLACLRGAANPSSSE